MAFRVFRVQLLTLAGATVVAADTAAASNPSLRGLAGEEASGSRAVADDLADTYPDVTTGFDIMGPYIEQPSEEEDRNPRPAIEGWDNETTLQAAFGASWGSWGSSFCQTHHTGSFCDGSTQVRCCKNTWGWVKCGSTWHSRSCGWGGGSTFPSSGSWHIHPGWRVSSYCQSHHTGLFCYQHKTVHCCNDYGHFVDCSTYSESSRRC